jgi:hypothetical protein
VQIGHAWLSLMRPRERRAEVVQSAAQFSQAFSSALKKFRAVFGTSVTVVLVV